MKQFVVFSEPQRERLAAIRLKEAGYETYLPVEREFRIARNRRVVVEKPLFPRYLFIGVPPLRDLYRAKSAEGVKAILSEGGFPKQISPAVIEGLKRAESLNAFDRTQKASSLRVGEMVQIDGPFAEFIGKVTRADSHRRVEVLLEVFGREIMIAAPLDKIKRAG